MLNSYVSFLGITLRDKPTIDVLLVESRVLDCRYEVLLINCVTSEHLVLCKVKG